MPKNSNPTLAVENAVGPVQLPSVSAKGENVEPTIGKWVPGYSVPVINERAVRAAAGILFLLGAIAWGTAFATGSVQWLKPFGMFFVFDMALRVGFGDRWSPTMILGRLAVMGQKPEWVGASQKAYAWWLGLGMATAFCASTGFLNAPLGVILSLCGLCLTLLFLETAFGICVGCKLQALFSKTEPMYCPGGVCETGVEQAE